MFTKNIDDILLINKFPDFNIQGFDIDAYNKRFKQSNVIINASSADVAYPEHWGCLSVKCAFGGNETYKVADRYYAVNSGNYFICNEGEYYSSCIAAKEPVESFTLNFSHQFVDIVARGLSNTDLQLTGQPGFSYGSNEFIQKLYPHGGALSSSIFRIKKLALNFDENKEIITEQYYTLLENLFLSQQHVLNEIKQVKAVKLSTRKELYKRLHYAKDYLESCYQEEVSIEKLALISCLNRAYFLREFTKYFKQTPHQYLIRKRMSVAKELILNTRLPVNEICFSVGYTDAGSFGKLFKKHFLHAPESYRALHKKVTFRP